MALQLDNPILELDLEEQLFDGVLHGSVVDYEGLLRELTDVDVVVGKQRTLLHVAVVVGKVDWVERLLGMGADPELRNGDDSSVVEVAQKMITKYPKNSQCQIIVKLVQMARERDGTRHTVQARGGSTSVGGDFIQTKTIKHPVPEQFLSMVSRLLKEITLLRNILSQSLVQAHSESTPIKETNGSLSKDTSLLRETKNSLHMEVTSLSGEKFLEGRESDDEIKAEMERDGALKKMESGINMLMQQFLSLNEAINDLKTELTSRDILLETLEVSVTSLADEWRPLKECMNEVNVKVEGVIGEIENLKRFNSDILQNVSCNIEEIVHFNCIESMMQKTKILNKGEGKISLVRGFYDRLFSTSTLTSCLLTSLQFHPCLKIIIDCDSHSIKRMKKGITDHDGVERNVADYLTFADFNDLKVYLVGKVDGSYKEEYVIGEFAMSLAQMSIYLCFKNGGRPYVEGDEVNGQQYKRILEETEEKRRMEGGNDLDVNFHCALNKKSQLAKEIYLIAAVPQIIAEYGSREGTSKLHQQLPSLLSYYEHHVMETLLNKQRACII